MISCILLTAGESQRFGSPKALANIDGKKAIERLQEHLIQSSLHEIVIVTGAQEHLIKTHVFNHSKVSLVYNKDYKLGQTSSFQKALSVVDEKSTGFMLLPVDCPFIQISTFDTLIKNFQKFPSPILIPTYRGQRGHPPIFSAQLKAQLLGLDTNQGLNTLIQKNETVCLEIDDPGIVESFNTQEELASLLRHRSN